MKDRKDVVDKVRVDFVVNGMPRALIEVARRCMNGDAKYGNPNTWQASKSPDPYTGAMMRHLLAEGSGEEMDEEAGLTHASGVAWNALVRLELMLRKKEALDKRKSAGKLRD